MHAGVFGARISEEAFKTLLDVMESNFAALTLPAEEKSNKKSSKIVITTRPNISLRVSRIVRNQDIREISGVLEIVFPIFLNPWPDKFIMKEAKYLEDDHTHEPMEIEEINLPETPEPIVVEKEEKLSKDSTRSKSILRESKLAKIFDPPKVAKSEPEKNSSDGSVSEIEKMKSKIRPLVKKEPAKHQTTTETSGFFCFWQTLFFILFPIAVAVVCACITRDEYDANKCVGFDATAALRELENRVFGQTGAIEDLRFHLSSNSDSRLTVIALIGGAGVGKSYAAHIIGENFTPKKNVFRYIPPLESRRKYAAGAASVCGCNLIVLENLGNRDILEAANFVDYLAGKIDENYCVFVLEVINVQETDNNLRRDVNLAKSTADIEAIYKDKKLDIKVVKFQPLTDDVLDKCIIYAAKSRNLTISQNDINDVRHSLKISDSGCKGARAKVQLLDGN